MTDKVTLARKAEKLNLLPVESDDSNIMYVLDPHDKKRIFIYSTSGRMIITRNQARTMIDELKGILEAF